MNLIEKIFKKKPKEKYGFLGRYSSYEEVEKLSSGYSQSNILQKVLAATLAVKEEKFVHERDSVVFDKIEYSWPLVAALMWIAAKNKGKIEVIDFGGSLGSSYFQNRKFINSLDVSWNVIEQPHFVKAGKEFIASDQLKFFSTIEDVFNANSFSLPVFLLSGSLQYLKDPYELLEKICNLPLTYIILDRTCITSEQTYVCLQKVRPSIYPASYPCWILNEIELLEKFSSYKLIEDFQALDGYGNGIEHKGYIFQKIKN